MLTKPRPAFTLMEVILTLAVLAAIVGITVPSYLAWMRSQNLGESVDELRAHLVQARTRAMEEGRSYRFFWEVGGNTYRIAPDEIEDWPELVGLPAGPLFSDAAGAAGFVLIHSLKEGVLFMPAGPLMAGPGAMPLGAVATSSEGQLFILFRPDGTATILFADGTERAQADIGLVNERGTQRVIRVRAITGGTTAFNPAAP